MFSCALHRSAVLVTVQEQGEDRNPQYTDKIWDKASGSVRSIKGFDGHTEADRER